MFGPRWHAVSTVCRRGLQLGASLASAWISHVGRSLSSKNPPPPPPPLGYWALLTFWRHGSVDWPAIHIDAAGAAVWPYSVGMLVKLCAFLSSLHWPTDVEDLGISGISFAELLIYYERCAGERLCLESAVLSDQKERTLNFGVGCSGWTEHRYLVSCLEVLDRFIPCRIVDNHCVLRALVWELNGHGLTSGPEAAGPGFLDDLPVLFGYHW